jgi:hypothetical protein
MALGVSEAVAQGVSEVPQPDQAAWVTALRLVPVVPVAVTLLVVAALALRCGRAAWWSMWPAHVLLWSSVLLLFVVAPKPD